MREIFFVKEEDDRLARSIEKELAALSEQAGLLFVSCQVIEVTDKDGTRQAGFHLAVGCERHLHTDTIRSLIALTVGDRLAGRRSVVDVYRGVTAAAAKSV